MEILVATNHLDRLGGSETFTYTLVEELRQNHNVDVFTLRPGDYLDTVNPKPEYDLILINHNTCLSVLKNVKGYKIFTSHGIYPQIEQPRPGADKYVSISEEVQDHLKELGYQSKLIRNGINCDRFKPYKPTKEIKKVLSMCQGKKAAKLVEKACQELGLEFKAIERNVWNVEDYINEADLVVTLGRGAYEAMACGRAVLVYDNRSYINEPPMGDGIVTDWQELAKHNFSGRRYKKQFSLEELKQEILKYTPEMGEANRQIALQHFNIKKQVKLYDI